MKTIKKTILVLMLLGLNVSANADVVQVWKCTLHDGKTPDDVMKASSAWLAAAKSMKGGGELKVYHEFPLAASPGPDGFNFVMIAPDAESWGVFSGGYESSAASKADEAWGEAAQCSGSSLWNSTRVN